jgi:PAS domain S-box-containing protein
MKRSAGSSPAKQKSFADELEERVAQRTAELTATIEQLKRELAERQRAKEALREGELFNLIVESIPVPIAITSPTGEVEALNKPTLEYFGRAFEELKDWKSSDVVHPDDLERTVAAQMEAHQEGTAYNVESRHRRADGVYRWFNVLGLPLRDAQERILHWFHLQIDIDDRKRAEEALRSAERNLSLTINTIPTLIQVSRPDGTVLSVNQAVLDYHGIRLQDVQTEDFRTRVYHPDDVKRLREERKEALERPLPFEYEQRALGKDGKYRWFLVRYNPLLDDQGRIDRWYATAFDIEDRKRAEALLAGEKRLLEMVAGGNTLISILDSLCRLVEETASGYICGILLLDTNGTSVELARGPSLPPGYNEAILKWPVNPDSGPCARAFFLKEQVIVADVVSDLQWDAYGWRPLALSYGLRACWSTPILSSENAVLGTFALYSREPGGPTPQLQDVIGQMTHLAAVAIGRQRVVEQLQAEQELLDLAQKSAGAMAFDWHIQQEINSWSPEQEALFGLPPGTFDGTYRTWKEMMYAPDWPTVVDAINHAHETGKVAAEYRVVWPDGTLHWLSTNGRMFFNDAGEPLRMVGFTSDVTRRKTIEEELHRSAAFLAQAQQLSRTGSFSWRVATDEITWSAELYRIYEFDPGTTITLEVIRTRVHPEDLTLYEKMVEQARNGSEDFEWQYRLLMPDQSTKYMHAVAQATRDPSGQLEYIAAVRDVTARRLSDEALDRARSEFARVARVTSLGALTASIAHEVNQPLSGIITNASTCMRMLDAEPPNVDGARETAKRTIRDGRRAADVITRLRALFANKDAAAELFDLNEATREVIALSRTELERNGVISRTELADELPLVTGDRVQLQQVILNLLRNGSDAMSNIDDRPRGLLFRTEVEEGGRVRLSVQDVGIGFEPQSLDRLFQTFYTTKEGGMGIGLAVSHSIIENHRGRMWATPNDGPGVTFSFSIPCIVDRNPRR